MAVRRLESVTCHLRRTGRFAAIRHRAQSLHRWRIDETYFFGRQGLGLLSEFRQNARKKQFVSGWSKPLPLSIEKLKDKGQRKVCGCMTGKDIGMYNTCPHHCIYCYANTSKEAVKKNLSLHGNGHESILNKQETSQLNT